MKLKNLEVKVGDDGKVILREPTNAEWNNFIANRYPIGRGNRPKDNSSNARAELFDKLLIAVENIEDDAGIITVETKERIPSRIKAEAVFKAFEGEDAVEIKN